MEKCMESEPDVFEHASQGSFSEDSPKKQKKNLEDLDFNDVFGGPPRRFSMQEVRVRYSIGELMVSEEDRISSPLSQRREKSVFGEESVVRRRYPSDDFFDDIFRGDESYSSPRRFDCDGDGFFEQIPSSRFSGLAPKPEIFGTSLPAQLSLPAKSTKALDFSAFASQNHGQFKMDGTSNQLNSSRSSSSSSRFYHQNPLASFSSEDSSSTVTSDLKNGVENLKRDNKSMESPTDGNQFHFSIYKWAGKGVPMLTPLVDRNNFKNSSRNDGFASTNGKTEGGFTESKTSVVTSQDLSANIAHKSLKIDCEKKNSSNKEEMRELQFSIEEALYDSLESKSPSISKNSVAFSGARQDIKTEEVKAQDEINTRNEVENEVPVKSEMKPLRAYLAEEVEQPEMRDNETRISKGDEFNVHDSKKVKKNEETRTNSNRKDANKSNFIVAATNSSVNSGKSRVKGKVKEFVQIFNDEADSRPKPDTHTRNQSNKWKGVGIDQKENEVNSNAAKVKEKVELDSIDKRPDISLKVDENLNKDEARVKSQTKTPSFRKSFRRDSKISVENSDDLFEDYFLVQELSDDHEKVTESDEGYDEMKALDAKIQQWSIGKKGNIRSLLSTLQFVLWPGNGWKSVPLVDLIESNAVKRAYQKALLRLHPDKLQQIGAASHQKYIAEKVFDILQEAWDQFNTLAPL